MLVRWHHGQKLRRSYLYFKIYFILRRPTVANSADIIKIATMFIKTTFKDLKKLKELEIIYSNKSKSLVLEITKVADFQWKNDVKGVCHVSYIFFGSSLSKV